MLRGVAHCNIFGFINPTFLKLMNYSAGKVQKFANDKTMIMGIEG